MYKTSNLNIKKKLYAKKFEIDFENITFPLFPYSSFPTDNINII